MSDMDVGTQAADLLRKLREASDSAILVVAVPDKDHQVYQELLCSNIFSSLGPWQQPIVLEITEGEAIVVPVGSVVHFRTILKEDA